MPKSADLKNCIALAKITEQYFLDYVRACAKIADPTISNVEEDNSYATPETVLYNREMFLSYRNVLRTVSNTYYDAYNVKKENPEIERVIRLTV